MKSGIINFSQAGFDYCRQTAQLIAKDPRVAAIWNPISSACKSVADWNNRNHTNDLAIALTEISPSLAPVPAIPFKNPEELLASQEVREKVAQIFNGQTLQQFYDGFLAYMESHDGEVPFPLREKSNRGSFMFMHDLLPGKIFKAYLPSPTDLAIGRNIPPLTAPINLYDPSIEEYTSWMSSEKNVRWSSCASACGRALMAARMRTAIHQKELDCLYVPVKTVCPISSKLDAETIVVAEKLDLMSEEESEQHLKSMPWKDRKKLIAQLYDLFYETGFTDAKLITKKVEDNRVHGANMLFIKSGEQKGKLAIFDTESFGLDQVHAGTHSEVLVEAEDPKKANPLYQNIDAIGGNRNLDLSIGRLISFNIFKTTIQSSPLVYPGFGQDYETAMKKADAEFRSNLSKIKVLRAAMPVTVGLSIAGGLIQRMFF